MHYIFQKNIENGFKLSSILKSLGGVLGQASKQAIKQAGKHLGACISIIQTNNPKLQKAVSVSASVR